MSKQTENLLDNEISLLYDAEAKSKVPAGPIIRQLVAWAEQPLPDVLPQRPPMREFVWPTNGEVGLTPRVKNDVWNPWKNLNQHG